MLRMLLPTIVIVASLSNVVVMLRVLLEAIGIAASSVTAGVTAMVELLAIAIVDGTIRVAVTPIVLLEAIAIVGCITSTAPTDIELVESIGTVALTVANSPAGLIATIYPVALATEEVPENVAVRVPVDPAITGSLITDRTVDVAVPVESVGRSTTSIPPDHVVVIGVGTEFICPDTYPINKLLLVVTVTAGIV